MKNNGKIKGLCGKLLIVSILLACIIVVMFQLASHSAKATNVSGYISSNTTWNASGNPYIVKGDIYVDEGINLTIEPGVVIKFDDDFVFYVYGNLSAQGNETDKIRFTSNELNPDYSDWYGIKVMVNGIAYIDNCTISYARYGIYLDSQTSGSTIVNSSISDNQYGVYLSYSSKLTLAGTNVSDNSYGIYIWHSTDTVIVNSNIYGNFHGIYASFASNIEIDSANIKENYYYGIDIRNSEDSRIINSNVSENHIEGIKLGYSYNITISNVQLWNNAYPVLGLEGNQKNHYDHQVLDTFVDGKPFYYFYGLEDETIEQLEAGAIMIVWSANLSVKDSTITNGDGIGLYYTTNSTITRCNVSDNYRGIYLYYSPNDSGMNDSWENIVSNNTIYNNTYGIKLSYSDNNEITDNNITSNDYGIHSSNSYTNWIYHNNFIDNDDQVSEIGSYWNHNFWDNGEEGNYWSDYAGSDDSGDGIGDWSYTVSSYSRDYLPLMDPWNGSLPPDTTPPSFGMNPFVSDRSLTLPADGLIIRFSSSEECYYEIIIDTDGTLGFDNTTDTTLIGIVTTHSQTIEWDGRDNDGNYVEDESHQIQVMLWDRAGNPIEEPYDAGSVSTVRDTDRDGIQDTDDAFPNDPTEWEDTDGDGIGDNSDRDWDNDGVPNDEDDFPWDRSESSDMDRDGIGDNADEDDNENGIPDVAEIPLALVILSIPVIAIYLTNKLIKKKEQEKGEDE